MSASASSELTLTVHVWCQPGPDQVGDFVTTEVTVSPDTSFLEMLDCLNEQRMAGGLEPIAFDHDCREGICGMCSLVINGKPHGPEQETTTCQLHMRTFNNGDTIYVEPFRAKGFPVLRDLIVDRGAFDRIQQAGGYVSVNTGSAPDAHAVPVPVCLLRVVG